jgi:hypothetical protein
LRHLRLRKFRRPDADAAPDITRATNEVAAGEVAVNIRCTRLEQPIIVAIVDILKALSNSFFD